MLEENYRLLKHCADEVDWVNMNKDDLFRKYVYENDEHMKEVYHCCVIMKYWGWIGILYDKCDHHLPITDCFDLMMEAIRYIAEKRVWEDKNSKLYGKDNAPSIAWFNVIKRRLHKRMAYLTAEKRKGDYTALSVDELHEEYNDAADGVFDEVTTDSELYVVLSDKRLSTFKKILIDLVCYGKEVDSDLTMALSLKEVDTRSFKYYNAKYGISKEDFNNFLNDVKSKSLPDLRREVRKSLYVIGKEYYGEEFKRCMDPDRDLGYEGRQDRSRSSEG